MNFEMGDSALDRDQIERSDFQCQVGTTCDTCTGPGDRITHLPEITGTKDVQCQTKAVTSDFQCQAKNISEDVNSEERDRRSGFDGHSFGQALAEERKTNSSRLTLTKSTSTEASYPFLPRPQAAKTTMTITSGKPPDTVSLASQCDLLIRATSSDVQCQTKDVRILPEDDQLCVAHSTAKPDTSSISAHKAGSLVTPGHHVVEKTQEDFQCQFDGLA